MNSSPVIASRRHRGADRPANAVAPEPSGVLGRLARILTGRGSAWAVLALFAVLLIAVMGGLRGGGPAAGMDALPASSESSRAQAIADQAEGNRYQPVFAVVTRSDGGELTKADQGDLDRIREALADASGRDALPPMPSDDGQADLVMTTVDSQLEDDALDAKIGDLRTATDQATSGTDLTASVTGGPAMSTDIRGAFAGANFTLLAVTIAVVAVLLLLTYRSPVLWLIPLTVVALADGASQAVTNTMGETFSLAFDAGVISVLVFGAGTNYALLLISRYREELRRHEDHRAALRHAWAGTVPAILASNLTVVLALLTLLVAVMPATRGLGVAAAVGLLIALLAALFPLPALLAVTGRRVFWPFVPRPDTSQAADDPERTLFGRLAGTVTRRPVIAVLASVAVLGILATGLIGTRIGLSQDEQFAVPNESATGFTAMAEHYGAGQSGPHRIVTPSDSVDAVTQAAEGVPGVESVSQQGTTPNGWSILSAVGSAEPESPAARTEAQDLRSATHDADPDALVGGTSATALDVHQDSLRDLVVIAPMILAVVLVVLIILLRAIVAPLVLLLVNVSSAVAAIGLGLGVGKSVFGIPALDITVPLLAFLFLVALGVDYTIFLVHRARVEAATAGTRRGIVRAVGSTGVVITSAGIVLAAVFAALGVLPLVVLGQLGLIVGLGVVLDTILVRTILVPALFALIGDAMWWPSRPHAATPTHRA